MKAIHRGGRSTKIAAAFGALLVTAGCAGIDTRYPQESGLPPHLDGGAGQLLRYCDRFHKSGDLVSAAAMCERAHKLEPENPVPLLQLAEILDEMEVPQQAVAAYRRILDSNPGHVEARYRLGKQYVSMEQYDLAADEFRAGLRHDPNDPRLYNALGIANGLFGDHLGAQDAFRKGLEVDPSHVSLRNNLALSLVLNGSHEEGIAMLEELGAGSLANATTRENLQIAYGMKAKADSDAALAEKLPDDAPQPATGDSPELAMTGPRKGTFASEVEDATTMADDGSAPSDSSPTHDGAPIALDGAMRPSDPVLADPAPEADPIARQVPTARRFGMVQTARAATADAPETYRADDELGGFLASTMEADASGDATEIASAAPTGTQSLAALAPSYGSGAYEVQLASYRSEADAMRGWSELSAQAGAALSGLEPVVRRADLGPDKGIYYRLRTPGFAQADAQSLCRSLKAQGIDCLVVQETEARPTENAARIDSPSSL